MLFALSVLDFRRKDTKFSRQTEQFFPFFSPFNIVTAPTLRIHLPIRLIRVLPLRFILSLRPNGSPRPLLANAKVAIQREQS